MKGLNEFLNEMFDAPRFWVKKNFGQFSVVDRENKDKMIVGYSKKEDAEKTANGLLASDEKDLEDIIKKLKTTSGYSMFLESIEESKEYKDPLSDKKFIAELTKLLKTMGMEDIELNGNDLFFHNPRHLDTGPIGKMKDSIKIEKLIQKFGYDDDEFNINSSLIQFPDEYEV